MRALLTLLVLLPGLALAQPRPFSCVGAEALEDDVFAVPFAHGSATPAAAAGSVLDAAAALARSAPNRNLCVFGHAGPTEGGAATGVQLAARRARAVATALAGRGVERDRVRAEARAPGFTRRAPVSAGRAVTVVVMPAR